MSAAAQQHSFFHFSFLLVSAILSVSSLFQQFAPFFIIAALLLTCPECALSSFHSVVCIIVCFLIFCALCCAGIAGLASSTFMLFLLPVFLTVHSCTLIFLNTVCHMVFKFHSYSAQRQCTFVKYIYSTLFEIHKCIGIGI
jgi:hypothetical protein